MTPSPIITLDAANGSIVSMSNRRARRGLCFSTSRIVCAKTHPSGSAIIRVRPAYPRELANASQPEGSEFVPANANSQPDVSQAYVVPVESVCRTRNDAHKTAINGESANNNPGPMINQPFLFELFTVASEA